MQPIQKVIIQRAEGLTDHYTMRKVTFAGDDAEANGNSWLREIAQTAPEHGGYDKTDVWITLVNGEEFEMRFDVQHTNVADNDTDLRQHLRAWLLYNSDPAQLPYIAGDARRLKYALANVTPDGKVWCEAQLTLLDGQENPCASE